MSWFRRLSGRRVRSLLEQGEESLTALDADEADRLFTAALIIPVFIFRHYVQDKGKFPSHMLSDLGLTEADMQSRKAGMLPYLTLLAGIIVMLVSNWYFVMPG